VNRKEKRNKSLKVDYKSIDFLKTISGSRTKIMPVPLDGTQLKRVQEEEEKNAEFWKKEAGAGRKSHPMRKKSATSGAGALRQTFKWIPKVR